MKRIIAFTLAGFLLGFSGISHAATVDPMNLERTIKSATNLIAPSDNATVSYDAETEQVFLSFDTKPDYNEATGDAYRRWRINQWAVLQEFMLSRIPVKFISVETQRTEDGTLVRYTHSKRHSDKYGDINGNKLWLRTGRVMQKVSGSDTWEKVK